MATARRQKIVIVEDDGVIAADLQAQFIAAGYLVSGTADSAQKAIEVIEETSPDLVLMDIYAYSDQETLERAGRNQAFGFINKPVATASLKAAIEVALSKHRYERLLREDWDAAIAKWTRGWRSRWIVATSATFETYLPLAEAALARVSIHRMTRADKLPLEESICN